MQAQDYWGKHMSGMEPILIGAALGAGASGIMGGNPLQGALLGAAGGGLGGLAGGAGGAASGAAGGASGAAGGAAGAAGGAATGAGGAVAQAFPVAAQKALTMTPLTATAKTILPQSASWAAPHLSNVSNTVNPATLVGESGLFDSVGVIDDVVNQAKPAPGLLDNINPSMLNKASKLMPQQQQQPQMSAPQMRRGQAPEVFTPIDELIRMQAKRQRRPISLLF